LKPTTKSQIVYIGVKDTGGLRDQIPFQLKVHH
jgi:hypothetical protein